MVLSLLNFMVQISPLTGPSESPLATASSLPRGFQQEEGTEGEPELGGWRPLGLPQLTSTLIPAMLGTPSAPLCLSVYVCTGGRHPA